jgi:hypothetical protein
MTIIMLLVPEGEVGYDVTRGNVSAGCLRESHEFVKIGVSQGEVLEIHTNKY